jgi:AraC-like DNA-binding protein
VPVKSDPDAALEAYVNAPHFHRAFNRLTGMTPRDYRRGLF